MKGKWFTKLVALAGLVALSSQSHNAEAQVLTSFADHGVPAQVSERRGAIAIRNKAGKALIVAGARDLVTGGPRTSLLVIDAFEFSTPAQPTTTQYFPPSANQNDSNGDTYCLLWVPGTATTNGKVYMPVGNRFFEFDIETRTWTYSSPTNQLLDGLPQAISRSRGADGSVYFATYPNCSLYRFIPSTQSLQLLTTLDDVQEYPTYLEADNDGWVYAGIGTEKGNIVAYKPTTGQKYNLVDQSTRVTGTSWVAYAEDATYQGIYARETPTRALVKLSGGIATWVAGNPANPNPNRKVTGAVNWGIVQPYFQGTGGGYIVDGSPNIPEKLAVVHFGGISVPNKNIPLTYTSNGSGITSLVVGPNSKIYGSTNHPMHFFSYTPATSTMVDHGAIPEVGGGNFGAFGVSGNYVVGDTYSFGKMYRYETTQPWNVPATGSPINPSPVGTFTQVMRPRAAVNLPNSEVLFGGFPDYGVVGGGLVKYLANGTTQTKTAAQLLPGHSTISMAKLDTQTVICGTTVLTTGGAAPTQPEAKLYKLNISTMGVVTNSAMVPVANAKAIRDIFVAPSGKVYGLTDTGYFFVYDPSSGQVVHTAHWENLGIVSYPGVALNPGHSMWSTANGKVCVLLPKYILQIDPVNYSVTQLANLSTAIGDTALAGGVVFNNRMYFGTTSRLRSVDLSPISP